jgi:signal transduction histidine kinase
MERLAPNAALSVTLAELDRLFPFLLVVDRELRIQHMGSSLERLLPEGQERVTLGQVFEFPRHADELAFDGLGADPMRCFILNCRARRELTLRGQFLRMGDLLVFAGAPRIGAEAMKSLGLLLSDFAAHDAIGDYLVLVQAQQLSLAEAARLSEELARVNTDLEARVREEIAERVRVEGELRLAQRLEAVGQLAAGVAHEINTPIQYVSDSLYFLSTAYKDLSGVLNRLNSVASRLRELGDPDAAAALDEAWEEADAEFVLEQSPKAVARALDGVERVAEIVRAMKAFAHPGADEAQPEDLNAALATTLVVAKNEYKYVADVATEFGELGPVTCRLGELNQVFLNLVVNAAHAIGDVVQGTEGRGRIVLRTRAEPGFAVVEIEDSGGGIPLEIQEKIWDPFFTTKPVGKGTGQGLTLARSIVVKHGGALSFESVMGKGTTFVIRLPLSSALEAKAEEAAAA